ncbi:MAG: phage holin family protein [Romboutsia sp.]|nr:phage holin family protein [Romboutsia sp.]
MDNKIKAILSTFGGVAGYLLGGLDLLLEVFAMILLVDTATGMFKSFYNGTYSSKKFREGLWKKMGYMLAIILAVLLDRLMDSAGTLRTALLFCFIANESASIIENLGEMGVPIPSTISKGIAILKNKSESVDNSAK